MEFFFKIVRFDAIFMVPLKTILQASQYPKQEAILRAYVHAKIRLSSSSFLMNEGFFRDGGNVRGMLNFKHLAFVVMPWRAVFGYVSKLSHL